MKQKLLALALCLGLLAGCSPDLSQYPRVEPAASATPPQVLTIDVPKDADQLTLDAVSQFAAAVLELSGGAVTIETIPSDRPVGGLQHGATHMAVLTNEMLIEEDPSLGFLDWPFLYGDPQQYLTVMGAQDGVIRGDKSLAKTLGGEIIGLWYGGRTVLLCRGAFYEEISFSNSSLGVLEGRPGSGFFAGIGDNFGAKTVQAGAPDELLSLLEDRAVKYLEYPLNDLDPEYFPEALKYVENTAHRIQGTWLVLGKDVVDPETARLLAAAAAFVPQAALEARTRQETETLDALAAQEIKVQAGEYTNLHRAAKEYFRKNHRELGCSQRVWDTLSSLLFP